MDKNCEQLAPSELVYYSGEQYLIVCLQICQRIIQNECSVGSLINLDSNYTINGLFSHLNRSECLKYGQKESHKLVLFISGIIVCLVILCLNLLAISTILRSRKLRSILQNMLIVNLSISDFLCGVAFLYPCIINLLTINALESYNPSFYALACSIRQQYYICLAGYSPIIASMLTSMFTLFLLALEKYLAILHPYYYEKLINEHRWVCYPSLALTWLLSIIVSLLPLMGWNEDTQAGLSSYKGFDCRNPQSRPCMFERIFTLNYILFFTGICGACALAMLAMYTRIYIIARRQSNNIAQSNSINPGRKHLAFSHHNMKAMKTLLILLLGMYLCWLPLIFYFLLFSTTKYDNMTIYILMFVACCNGIVDPIVYAFRSSQFRRRLLLNFKKTSCR